MCYDVINHSLAKFILDFSEFDFSYDTMVIEDNLKCKVPPLETATATSESSSAQPSSVLPPATSVLLPTASSTGGASFDADTENPEIQGDKSDSEPESDQGDEPPAREPKYKVGTFVRKEVDVCAAAVRNESNDIVLTLSGTASNDNEKFLRR